MGVQLSRALVFAATKHSKQRRKNAECDPYINHPLRVLDLLVQYTDVDHHVLTAAVLHDTVEDTDTTFAEIEHEFGSAVRGYVAEVTDDRTLPRSRRHELQVEHAPAMSQGAKLIKLADKADNMRDLARGAIPVAWTRATVIDRANGMMQVVDAGLRGLSSGLEQLFDDAYDQVMMAVAKPFLDYLDANPEMKNWIAHIEEDTDWGVITGWTSNRDGINIIRITDANAETLRGLGEQCVFIPNTQAVGPNVRDTLTPLVQLIQCQAFTLKDNSMVPI
jgi:guanosine-3',5'-bis(diphosphate) 3'-pyrophosphohydrolase